MRNITKILFTMITAKISAQKMISDISPRDFNWLKVSARLLILTCMVWSSYGPDIDLTAIADELLPSTTHKQKTKRCRNDRY
jgi:hypothetical protein